MMNDNVVKLGIGMFRILDDSEILVEYGLQLRSRFLKTEESLKATFDLSRERWLVPPPPRVLELNLVEHLNSYVTLRINKMFHAVHPVLEVDYENPGDDKFVWVLYDTDPQRDSLLWWW
jgi:hypothetical protein